MSARDAVATQLPATRMHVRDEWADEILKAITAAGYRILAPGDVDRETVERCAKVARECFDDPQAEADPNYIPAAIRTLTDGGHDA